MVMTMKPKVHISPNAQAVLNTQHMPEEVTYRLIARHRHDPIRRNLPTPQGGREVLLSFHPLLTADGAVTLVIVQASNGDKYVFYTDAEFKAILKESLSLRSMG